VLEQTPKDPKAVQELAALALQCLYSG
jgi:hypothetical protein